MSSHADILVVGAGAAGVAAAVSAARAGCATILLDQRPAPGGIGGHSGLTTLCGLYDDSGRLLNEGFACEFAAAVSETVPLRLGKVWVLPYRPEKFREVANQLIAAEPRLEVRWSSSVTKVVLEQDRIVSVNGLHVGAVIDCSGTAAVARCAGVPCLATDETTQAAAVVFSLHHLHRPLATPADAARVLLPLLRAGFPPVSFQPCVEPNAVTVKFSGSPEQAPQLLEFLRTHVAGFEDSTTPVAQFRRVARAGRMVVGAYVLTGEDVLAGRKVPDAVARCAWPIEQWSADGVARFRYLPPETHYEIPARSLRAAALANLFMAGKTLSADVDAIASARVMGCCLATGAAAGVLAARSLQSPPHR